jgi:hypothetical protein
VDVIVIMVRIQGYDVKRNTYNKKNQNVRKKIGARTNQNQNIYTLEESNTVTRVSFHIDKMNN